MDEVGLSPALLEDLLQETSRTFALAIPLLPEPVRRAVGVAYLLFRVADTLEDAEAWPRDRRIHALDTFAALLRGEGDARAISAGWLAEPPLTHAGYLRLLGETPALLDSLAALPSAEIVRAHTLRTTLGMREVIEQRGSEGDRMVRLRDLADLRQYCYYVAGIVGELLTDVFVFHAPSLHAELPTLREEERLFGEGLQLVNILKDEADDASEDRVFIPKGVERTQLLALARADLEAAQRYTDAIARGGAPAGVRAFVGLPLALARESLDAIEARGAGAKMPRARVLELFTEHQALAASE